MITPRIISTTISTDITVAMIQVFEDPLAAEEVVTAGAALVVAGTTDVSTDTVGLGVVEVEVDGKTVAVARTVPGENVGSATCSAATGSQEPVAGGSRYAHCGTSTAEGTGNGSP